MSNIIPDWLHNTKIHITSTHQWKSYIDEIYSAIHHQMKENDTSSFDDLTKEERDLFINRSIQALDQSSVQTKLNTVLSQRLEKDIACYTSNVLLSQNIKTYSNCLQDTLEDGILSILNRHPKAINKLLTCFNREFPEKLRKLLWTSVLSNKKVAKEYNNLLAVDARQAISPDDALISGRCEHVLLEGERGAESFAPLLGSVGCFYAMKSTLSYYDVALTAASSKKKKSQVREGDASSQLQLHHFHLIAPLLHVRQFSRNQPPSIACVVDLIEHYFSLHTLMTNYYDGSSTTSATLVDFTYSIAPTLCQFLADLFTTDKEEIISSEKSIKDAIRPKLDSLTKGIFNSLFSSYLNLDVNVYIWNQLFLVSSIMDFGSKLLVAYVAIYLKLMSRLLKKCNNEEEIINCLKTKGIDITINDFQNEIESNFKETFKDYLDSNFRNALPVFESLNKRELWNLQDDTQKYEYLTPVQRQEFRRNRQETKKLQDEDKKEKDEKAMKDLIQRQKEKDEYYQNKEKEDNLKLKSEMDHYIDLLRNEKKRRELNDMTSKSEIDRLKAQVSYLIRHRENTPDNLETANKRTLGSLIAPPASANTSTDGDDLAEVRAALLKLSSTSQPVTSNDPATPLHSDIATHDVERKRINIADNKTTQFMKRAEREVLGREFEPGEFEKLDESERMIYAEKILNSLRTLTSDE